MGGQVEKITGQEGIEKVTSGNNVLVICSSCNTNLGPNVDSYLQSLNGTRESLKHVPYDENRTSNFKLGGSLVYDPRSESSFFLPEGNYSQYGFKIDYNGGIHCSHRCIPKFHKSY